MQQAKQNAMTEWIADTRAEFAKKTLYAAGYGPSTRRRRAAER